MLVDNVCKKINWFCCLVPLYKIYNGYFLWPTYTKFLFLCVWYLFSVTISLDGGSQHCDFWKAPGASVISKSTWSCETQVKSYKLSHFLYRKWSTWSILQGHKSTAGGSPHSLGCGCSGRFLLVDSPKISRKQHLRLGPSATSSLLSFITATNKMALRLWNI